MTDFTQQELRCIILALRVWIDGYYKTGSRAWQEKIDLLEKVKSLIEPENNEHNNQNI